MYFFNDNKEILFNANEIEQAYLSILGDDFDSAYKIFAESDSPRAKWGISLISILKGYIMPYPTYFQIRNFLEIDLDFLLKNGKIDYVEMVLGASEILLEMNQEAYKYIARVMFENKFYKSAKEYLEKSKNVLYNDPEMHFLFAKYYLIFKDFEKADLALDNCLKYVPDYYPAKQMQKEIARYLV